MDAYIYAADIYCADCAKQLARDLPTPLGADLADESSFDSDQYPKGPYADGGGEADVPQHCASCGVFLDNPLTEDGSAYVKSAWREFVGEGRGNLAVLIAWRDGYINEWSEFSEQLDEEIERNDRTDLEVRRYNDLETREALT